MERERRYGLVFHLKLEKRFGPVFFVRGEGRRELGNLLVREGWLEFISSWSWRRGVVGLSCSERKGVDMALPVREAWAWSPHGDATSGRAQQEAIVPCGSVGMPSPLSGSLPMIYRRDATRGWHAAACKGCKWGRGPVPLLEWRRKHFSFLEGGV